MGLVCAHSVFVKQIYFQPHLTPPLSYYHNLTLDAKISALCPWNAAIKQALSELAISAITVHDYQLSTEWVDTYPEADRLSGAFTFNSIQS